MSFKIPQIAKITDGPHLLFTGGNGRKCFGITVKALEDGSKHGLSNLWNINSYSIHNKEPYFNEYLGITDEEYSKLISELDELEKQNDCLKDKQ